MPKQDHSYFYSFNKLDYVQGMKKPEGCILCHLRDHHKNVENLCVHEDSHFLVSINLYPYNPAHLIVFPRRHVEDIREYSEEEVSALHSLTSRFLTVLEDLYSPKGFNIGYNQGQVAGASISHLHCHIIPRYPGEIGISDLIGGQRVLVEDPRVTRKKILNHLKNRK
ncbi:MAG: HIT domain-containing protein [Spirochaetales bacterium]|nr:HIT domain-containing protein [Spirochaetales bacterium]